MPESAGTLYIVATPIGNLEDITLRAARLLGEVDKVLAEDTRRTRRLLTHLGHNTPTISLHDHNERGRIPQVIGWLEAGETLALVSDAGTPGISDPGFPLVRALVAEGHKVVPIPGASALVTAASPRIKRSVSARASKDTVSTMPPGPMASCPPPGSA